MRKLIYRVENEIGEGPYRSDCYEQIESELGNEWGKINEDHPTPYHDGIPNSGFVPFDYIFGFVSREQLDRWFDRRSREVLREYGFKVVRYYSSQFFEGRHQVCFEYNSCEPEGSEPL